MDENSGLLYRMLRRSRPEVLSKRGVFNPLSANPRNGQTHLNNSLAVADEWFGCV